MTGMFRGLVKKYNKYHEEALPKVMTPHTLRHTFCTNMANAGMNPKALQYIMGHSNINMTLKATALTNTLRYCNVLHSVHKLCLSCSRMPYGTAFHLYADCICSPFFQYVNACIRIPVMNRVTFWALPDTNAQIFHQGFRQPQKLQVWLLGYIVGTLRISFPYQNRLIFQHFKKLCPGNTCYGFCQFMVPDHSFHIQIFDADGLVFAHQHR